MTGTKVESPTRHFIEQLRDALGRDHVQIDRATCWTYGYDNSRGHAEPAAVAFPGNHEEVRQVVSLCHEHHVALVVRGSGTGTAGAAVPVPGGLVLSTERLNRIVSVDPDNRVVVAEPGVTNQAVQAAAKTAGFFWPPDPTSAAVCTVGGNLSTNAAGPRAVKYGTTRDNVLGVRAVAGDGREFRAGVYTTKGVVGYDLTRLLIGAEGTLAVITEANLRLTPLPEAKRTLQAIYNDVTSAAAAVSRIMAQPVTPSALEFMDGKAIAMIRDYSGAELPEAAGALLMIEVDGPESCIGQAADAVAEAARGRGCLQVKQATTPQEVIRLWETRKALSPALRTVAPKKVNEDVVVPVSHIPDLVTGLDALSQRFGITIVNFGHAGNGNLHVNLLADPDDPRQMEAVERCLSEVFELVLSLGGTLSGEHGIGSVKRDYVAQELDQTSLDLMWRIKAQFDPAGILNPGKKLPPLRP